MTADRVSSPKSASLVRILDSGVCESLRQPVANGAIARRLTVWTRPDFEAETGVRVPCESDK